MMTQASRPELNAWVNPFLNDTTHPARPACLARHIYRSDYFFCVVVHEYHSSWRRIRWGHCCAQVTQLLAAAWAQHSDENPLVVVQLDIVNAYPSVDRQAQFDVLAGRASKSYDNGHVQIGDVTSPVLLPYTTIGVTLNPCKVPLPLCTSATTRVRLIRLRAAKAVNRAKPLKLCVLQLPLSPRLAECLSFMLLAPGPPSAMMSSSLHHLQKVLLFAELKQVLKQDLDFDVPKFNYFFPVDRINDEDHTKIPAKKWGDTEIAERGRSVLVMRARYRSAGLTLHQRGWTGAS